MFEFKIDGLCGAQTLLDNTKWPTKAVSLVSPGLKDWQSRGDHHLIVRFDDVATYQLSPDYPRQEQIEEVLDFTKDLTDSDKLLVHCHLGQSRSTAMMIGVLVQHGMTDREAFDLVAEHRPILMPNDMIMHYIDKIYGTQLAAINYDHRKALWDNNSHAHLKSNLAKNKAYVDSVRKAMDILSELTDDDLKEG